MEKFASSRHWHFIYTYYGIFIKQCGGFYFTPSTICPLATGPAGWAAAEASVRATGRRAAAKRPTHHHHRTPREPTDADLQTLVFIGVPYIGSSIIQFSDRVAIDLRFGLYCKDSFWDQAVRFGMYQDCLEWKQGRKKIHLEKFCLRNKNLSH